MDYAYMMIIGLLMVAIAAAVIIIAKLGKLQKDTQMPLTQTDLLHMS